MNTFIELSTILMVLLLRHVYSMYSMPKMLLPSKTDASKRIRLVDGPNDLVGRLEILQNSTWFTVCDDSFGDQDAKVACRQLGLSEENLKSAKFINNLYGAGTGEILENLYLHCDGSEQTLADCQRSASPYGCSHREDVSISCVPAIEDMCSEISSNQLYACSPSTPGSFGYHVCESSAEMESLGFTSEICMDLSQEGEFYAIQPIDMNMPVPDLDNIDLQNAIAEGIEFLNKYRCVGFDAFKNESTAQDLIGLIYGCSNLDNAECPVLNTLFEANTPNVGAFYCTDNPIPGTGCKQQSEEIELIKNKVYACNGVRYSAISDLPVETIRNMTSPSENIDVDEASILDYMLCGDRYHVCNDATELDYLDFGDDQCADSRFNDKFYGTSEICDTDGIYGCSANGKYMNPNDECILNSVINEESLFKTDGVLCCIDATVGKGCVYDYMEDEIIAGNVSSCYGTYNDIKDAELRGCASFYHVCNSAEELKAKGFTQDQCSNIGVGEEFFATLEGIQDNNNKCAESIDGIWGCSSSINSETIGMCSPLNSVLENGELSGADGILCCADGDWVGIAWEDMAYMVSLRRTSHFCGGSILTLDGHNGNGVILTAAHCVTDTDESRIQKKPVLKDIENMKVAVGCTSTACDEARDSKAQLYSIEKIVANQGFGASFYEDDIALIFLDAPINHTNAIPVTIESNPMIAEDNAKVKLTGYYGQFPHGVARGGSDITELEYAFTNIMARDECREYDVIYGKYTITAKDFCIKDDVGTDGMVMACMGDSGSPLLYQGKQIGLVSWGLGDCDPSYPDVQTYVPYYYQWIIDQCGAECMVNDGYLGCYNDDENNPTLLDEITKNKNKINNKNKDKRFSIDKCQKECNGYTYFALQNEGRKCFCGNDYESATRNGTSRDCGLLKLGGLLSNSLFVHAGFEQKQYLPDNILKTGIELKYGPGKGANKDVVYTVESCRISCSNFKYFSVSKDGECKCDNEYVKSYDKHEYDRHGLFKNVLTDGIEIKVNCDNFLRNVSFTNHEYNKYVPLLSSDQYNYDDWTKTQTFILPNSANCGNVRISCANAKNDDGPAGLMIGIKYKNQYISSNKETINNIITLVDDNGINNNNNNKQIVLPIQTSTTPLSNKPYFAKWIWTCGDDGKWDKCDKGLENAFEIDLCKLSVADNPNVFHWFITKKHVTYLFFSIISVVINIILGYVFCCKSSSKKYTKVKRVQFDDESDTENEEV